MYKGTARSLARRHHVDLPHPSKGYIDGGPDANDVLCSITSMSASDLAAERKHLLNELFQFEQSLAIAKCHSDRRRIIGLGQSIQGISRRISIVKEEIQRRNIVLKGQALDAAIKEMVSPELAKAIFVRAQQLRDSA